MYSAKNHMFVICAYKENHHIETTIQSLLNQTVKSKIVLSTSTPNDFLREVCDKYNITMIVNPERKGAGCDWNYAYDHADTELVTIAHQDDFYEPQYVEKIIDTINKYKEDDVILAFTDYYEYRNDTKVMTNKLLKIKRVMNWPLTKRGLQNSIWMRNRILSFGCTICCPAVTYVKKNAGDSIFDTKYINSCDYKTWVDLAKIKGAFVYIPEPLIAHRIYAGSATTANLSENIRAKEDLEIFNLFWPKPIAKFINNIYKTSEKSNVV